MDKFYAFVDKNIKPLSVLALALFGLVVLYNLTLGDRVRVQPGKETSVTYDGLQPGITEATKLSDFGKVQKTTQTSNGELHEFSYNTKAMVKDKKIIFIQRYALPDEQKYLAEKITSFGKPDFEGYYWEQGYRSYVFLDDGVSVVVRDREDGLGDPSNYYEVRYFIPTSQSDFFAKWGEGILAKPPDPRFYRAY